MKVNGPFNLNVASLAHIIFVIKWPFRHVLVTKLHSSARIIFIERMDYSQIATFPMTGQDNMIHA